ncbi:MAG: hypothetical protein JSS09_03185, partial [Verrucomicrobia bacterium]|nr:hypothetical protein [Verrucomicrobiota bacterium]
MTIAYMGLSALIKPMSPEELQHLATRFMEKALPSVQYEQKRLEKTEEYQRFTQLTNAPLDRIYRNEEAAVQKALEEIKADPKKALEIAKEYIDLHVGSHESYYQSNPLNLCSLGFHVKALTATPWNRISYPQALRNNVVLESGTEGRIMDVILRRADTGVTKIHSPKSTSIMEALQVALKDNPRKKQFRTLLDAAGLFSDYSSNEKAAEDILSYFKDDPSIEAVLFYAREAGVVSGIPDNLKILKKMENGEFAIEGIGGTRKELLQAKGINPAKTITYYDQKHCEATDIPQIADAFGLVTVNNHLIIRDLLQTNFRLRGYLKEQDVDFILPESEKRNYPESFTVKDILTQTIISQVNRTAEDGFSSHLKQIDDILRKRAYDLLLKSPNHETLQTFRDIFVAYQDFSPYVLFGRQKEQDTPLKLFKAYRQEQEKKFSHIIDGPTKKLLDDLEGDIEKNIDCFPL